MVNLAKPFIQSSNEPIVLSTEAVRLGDPYSKVVNSHSVSVPITEHPQCPGTTYARAVISS